MEFYQNGKVRMRNVEKLLEPRSDFKMVKKVESGESAVTSFLKSLWLTYSHTRTHYKSSPRQKRKVTVSRNSEVNFREENDEHRRKWRSDGDEQAGDTERLREWFPKGIRL